MHTFLLCLTILACIILATTWQETVPVNDIAPQVIEKTNLPGLKSEKKISLGLNQIALGTLSNHFEEPYDQVNCYPNLDEFQAQFMVPENYKISKGVFVTFFKDGKTRACWGSIHPKYQNLVEATVYASEDALAKEYRHKPIQPKEIRKIQAQVTVVNGVVPVNSTSSINPLRDGLMVRARGKGAVILPGETCDNHMQLVMAKLKANIKSNESCQLYRIETDVYK